MCQIMFFLFYPFLDAVQFRTPIFPVTCKNKTPWLLLKRPDFVRSGRSQKFPSNKVGFFLRCSQLLLGFGGRETGSNASHLKIRQVGSVEVGCFSVSCRIQGKAIKLRIGKMEQQRWTLNTLNFSCGFDVNTSWSCIYTKRSCYQKSIC